MFGWEFPPYYSGGLGTACFGLTKSMSKLGAQITFVIPHAPDDIHSDHVKLVGASNSKIRIKTVSSILTPYISENEYNTKYLQHTKGGTGGNYGRNLYEEVRRYAMKARMIAEEEDFEIIHAHDWLTAVAGVEAKKASGKPLVLHIHATEFDRTGGNPNQYVYDIERYGMHNADRIIAVSNFTKEKIVNHYGVPADKVEVVHNAVEFSDKKFNKGSFGINKEDKVVLFLGRITIQKGPDYFLYAAKKVLESDPHVKFVMAGNGDMQPFIIEKAAELGIADRLLFTGFLRGPDIDRAYAMADLYVMPSVSEPFGITPLEALRNNTPVLISKQSGVSEVLQNCLKVDFWDVHDMANKIIATLKYRPLHEELTSNGVEEVYRFSWDNPARKCLNVYEDVLRGVM
ncbi:glycosyltransferase family 4 protein [Candidatus Woesearchaeota archaeon]|nr:glycosyltransferase family 4 protein [Candidatus Woesearchaeota archaeon]